METLWDKSINPSEFIKFLLISETFPRDGRLFPYGEHSMENMELEKIERLFSKTFVGNMYSSQLPTQWLFRLIFIFYATSWRHVI